MGSGLAGMSTAVELLDQGYEVDIYEQRPFIGGKVASYRDKSGNHIEMGYVVQPTAKTFVLMKKFVAWVFCSAQLCRRICPVIVEALQLCCNVYFTICLSRTNRPRHCPSNSSPMAIYKVIQCSC